VVSTAPFHPGQLANHGQQMLWLRIIGVLVLSALLVTAGRIGSRLGERRTSLLIAVPLLVLMLAHAWDGHASVGSWQVVAVAAAMLHLVAVTAWIGGLLLLVTRLVPVTGDPGTAARWSLIAGSCVATIAVTGVIQAVRQISPLASLWSTEYGVLVITKVALLASIVCVAFFLRRRLLRRGVLATGLLGIELTVLVLVLGVTGVLQSRTPAHDDYGPPLVAHAPLGTDDLRVSLSTTRPGPVTIRVSRRHGTSPAALERLDGTLVGNVEGPVTLPLSFHREHDGSWSARGNLPTAGNWRLQFNAELSAELAYATTVTFRVW
jgi:copper transport protein